MGAVQSVAQAYAAVCQGDLIEAKKYLERGKLILSLESALCHEIL